MKMGRLLSAPPREMGCLHQEDLAGASSVPRSAVVAAMRCKAGAHVIIQHLGKSRSNLHSNNPRRVPIVGTVIAVCRKIRVVHSMISRGSAMDGLLHEVVDVGQEVPSVTGSWSRHWRFWIVMTTICSSASSAI